jgi:hypothetical protein
MASLLAVTNLNALQTHRFLQSLSLISFAYRICKEQRVIKNYAEDYSFKYLK